MAVCAVREIVVAELLAAVYTRSGVIGAELVAAVYASLDVGWTDNVAAVSTFGGVI
ncbi:hypothetical protein [Halorhabdus rudnickae]|uniref:hypothetical protein n=1 Tax=Halorhabdus rudnickae TaxID=1775544 RepID=UPI001438467B|nr:hypothetical protein [Halorhabdus rudnickae]